MRLQNLFSVRLNFSKCWFLAGSAHQIISGLTVSHPALVNVNRSNVIWDVSRSAEIDLPLAYKAVLFSLFVALNAPSPLPPLAWNTQTIKPVADSVNIHCSCGTKVGFLASCSSIQHRDWENQNSSDKNTYQMLLYKKTRNKGKNTVIYVQVN